MPPPAPRRFSTTKPSLKVSASLWLITRAIPSVLPPAANGVITVTVRFGQSVPCARATPGTVTAATARAAARPHVSLLQLPLDNNARPAVMGRGNRFMAFPLASAARAAASDVGQYSMLQ